MKEDFVQMVWKFQLFNQKEFTSIDGQKIRVVHPGYSHINAGPDFIASKIYIDDLLWVGNVEIHVNSSEWYSHHHHKDAAYNNVILHVVYKVDGKPCFTQNNTQLNTLVLSEYIDAAVLQKYRQLAEDMRVLPCKHWWTKIDESVVEHWLERMCISRLEEKCDEYSVRLTHLNEHWDQLFLEILARQLGFHVNSEPMARLARSIRTEWFQKNVDNPLFVEAILFGQAGMLNRSFKDEYPNQLKDEYHFISKKLDLTPLEQSTWKFSKLRPSNFPTIRIAQLAAILQKHPRFFSDCLDLTSLEEAFVFFDVRTHKYWDTHYVFDKEGAVKEKRLGEESIYQIILNCICTVWILYGNKKNEEGYVQKALDIMEVLKVENNRYVAMFNETGYNFSNCIHSQGLRYLWEYYCDDKKCLNCTIGIQGLKLKL